MHSSFPKPSPVFIAGVIGSLFHCCSHASHTVATPELEWTAYRIRENVAASLNEDAGWAAETNQSARIRYDTPFRIRFEVQSTSQAPFSGELRLQYRKEMGAWKMAGLSDFPYPRYATPDVSIIAKSPYAYGEETEDLLRVATRPHEEGIGLKALQATPLFHLGDESTEWEWPLVIRRFYDGAGFNEDDIKFDIRVVDGAGRPISGLQPIEVTGHAAPGHLGGTFIETPGRIGPYQDSDGRLYFPMEPSETFNRFMVVASDDHGVSWREVDGAGRPSIGDLEGVGSVFEDGIIHIVHQTSDEVLYHAFATADSKHGRDGWIVDSQIIARPSEPPTQTAAMTSRQDGQLLVAYGSESGGFLHLSGDDLGWKDRPINLETEDVTGLSGFQLATGADGNSFVVFTAGDGSGWMRILDTEGRLSDPLLISRGLGAEETENGAILPIIALPSGGALVVYRKDDGSLWECVWKNQDGFSPARPIPGPAVVSGAVDSDQVGADAIELEGKIHLLFIDEATRSINYAQRALEGEWSSAVTLIDGINAAWVRGNGIKNEKGEMVYGFVYDAGSLGGAGMNRFDAVPVQD